MTRFKVTRVIDGAHVKMQVFVRPEGQGDYALAGALTMTRQESQLFARSLVFGPPIREVAVEVGALAGIVGERPDGDAQLLTAEAVMERFDLKAGDTDD